MYGTLITSLMLAGGASPEAPDAWLESELRRRYETVTEWRIREVLPQHASQDLKVQRFEVGALGSRSLVVAYGRDGAGRPGVARHWYEVAGFGPGVVTTRPLAALTALTPDMVDSQPVDVMAQPCAPLTDRAVVVGMRLLQSRRRGDGLCASMVEPMPAVARGKTVEVQVTAGAVVLRAEAVALADAGVGERVLLSRPAHSDRFWGVVTGAGEVRIDE